MIKIDLITGFLGSGKTTFIKKYAQYYMDQGIRVCILENDFGAVNVDMLLLNDLYEKGCGLEMLAGACDPDCHKRRLKTKLISMRMLGYQRVIVEPSGIYDTEEFFDVLQEEPLDAWYQIDNVISLVDAGLSMSQNHGLSEESEYLLATQLMCAGVVVFSKTDVTSPEIQKKTVEYLNEILKKHGSTGKLTDEGLVGVTYEQCFEQLKCCGYKTEVAGKMWFDQRQTYDSLYFMNLSMTKEKLESIIRDIFSDTDCGNVVRVKGFVKEESSQYLQINVTRKEFVISTTSYGQEVLIVIGEKLSREKISEYIGKPADTL